MLDVAWCVGVVYFSGEQGRWFQPRRVCSHSHGRGTARMSHAPCIIAPATAGPHRSPDSSRVHVIDTARQMYLSFESHRTPPCGALLYFTLDRKVHALDLCGVRLNHQMTLHGHLRHLVFNMDHMRARDGRRLHRRRRRRRLTLAHHAETDDPNGEEQEHTAAAAESSAKDQRQVVIVRGLTLWRR